MQFIAYAYQNIPLRSIMAGMLALVGSGEYLPVMLPLEKQLVAAGLQAGRSPKYVQLATAAGKEGFESLAYWKNLGAQQAQRIGIEPVFVEILNREDAFRAEFVEQIADAALIYLSGGNPSYLAQTLIGTPALAAIITSWRAGCSLAGCSAGAMALAGEIANPFKLTATAEPGFNIVPNLKILPHFDRYFGWIPTPAAKLLGRSKTGALAVGIDENTALVSHGDLNFWQVQGQGAVQLLNGSQRKLSALTDLDVAQEMATL